MNPSKRLEELGLSLPSVAAPVANYIPAIRSGRYVFTSGQIPVRDGKVVWTGQVPDDVSVENAADAAEISVLNALAAIARLVGGVDEIVQVVRMCVYVNSSPGFTAQPTVANGASDLLVKIFGDAGHHVRAAVGVAGLPLDSAVELDLMVEVAGS